MKLLLPLAIAAIAGSMALSVRAAGIDDLSMLQSGNTAAENALWVETPPDRQFKSTTRVVCADIAGPGEITMMHFAYPESDVATTKTLGRELLLRVYWDDEKQPSVDCPLVDFFCSPNGQRKIVNTAMVNVCRGYNAYFPMPFRKHARVELVYDGPLPACRELWHSMPCYSYVMYRKTPPPATGTGYFHANWRREVLKLGSQPYVALEADGHGKFVGWNVTIRRPGRNNYPVDMNENFYIDGATSPAVELQGIEDSFGFSWGFPHEENMFPFTGWFPFLEGAFAYRFFLNDSISFQKSLRVTIAFGPTEKNFIRQFSKPGSALELGTTCYWYQAEPHKSFKDMPPLADRLPCPSIAGWPDRAVKDDMPTSSQLFTRGVKLLMLCGHPSREIAYAENGFNASTSASTYTGFDTESYYCRYSNNTFEVNLTVPPGTSGKLRLFIQDPDHFKGGRHERIEIAGKSLGDFVGFDAGKWIEVPLTTEMTRTGGVPLRISNLNPASNAVLSRVEIVSK